MKRSPLRRGTSVLRRTRLRRASDKTIARADADREWRTAILERHGGWCFLRGVDPGTFDHCGGPVDAHHIAAKGRWPELRHVLSNGVALCRMHHEWVHNHPREARALGLLR